jgi:hypothetical protein
MAAGRNNKEATIVSPQNNVAPYTVLKLTLYYTDVKMIL